MTCKKFKRTIKGAITFYHFSFQRFFKESGFCFLRVQSDSTSNSASSTMDEGAQTGGRVLPIRVRLVLISCLDSGES